ncbi:hypothetical protein CI102_6322 [Trichoderma harzianum]|uniref:Uncharacterized protein n=1 Tax=Trichoderma harzianum CBS 226.95 TaxID=983964 RepID=A0A2T4A987_TRIHA|nr:hypothetical protein M431DRAFT_496794 [Trichoderma harzianum CBS 226.95]PKK48836.1 hypothetical protein CI102_6322 [Trichoderma harzianum]PTB53498.1 hypothetical protein M431DRAFT_496794 [Trichoderma harzianum CBS 226.95]
MRSIIFAFGEAQGISNVDWQLGMRNANATGTASISGYNVTAKYPGERSDNWTVSISVSSDIPGGNTAGGQFVTGTQIEWTAPQGLIGSADPSWFLCRTTYSSSKLKKSGSAPSQGSCNGILSDNCWSDLQESLEAGRQCQNNTLPPSCADELGLSDGEGFGLSSARPVKSNSSDSTSLQLRFGDESHELGNFTTYDSAIRQIWVVVTGFAQADSDNAHPRGSAGQPGSVACIQASEVQRDSRDFEDTASIAPLSLMRILAGVTLVLALI